MQVLDGFAEARVKLSLVDNRLSVTNRVIYPLPPKVKLSEVSLVNISRMDKGVVMFYSTFAINECHILRVKQKLRYLGGIMTVTLGELEAKTQRESLMNWTNFPRRQSF